MQWRNLYRGFFMGICDIVPGVSGGTMALILGIYENFIRAVSGFFSREWKNHLGFLIPLGAGMMFAIVSLANAMNFLLFIMAFLALYIGGAAQQEAGSAILELTAQNAWLFFVAGWIASMAMLLPGVSGAFVLLLFGVYQTATNALSVTNPNLPVILLVGSGIIVGFIISSKGIRYLFHHYPSYTYAGIIGLIIGAAFTIFPGFGNGSAAASTFAFAAGTAAAYVLSLKQP